MESVKTSRQNLFLKNWRKKIRQIAEFYGIDISFDEKSVSKQRPKTFRENSEIVFRENIVSAQYRLGSNCQNLILFLKNWKKKICQIATYVSGYIEMIIRIPRL